MCMFFREIPCLTARSSGCKGVKGVSLLEDWQHITQYAHERSDDAFRILVERHRDWVYSTCFRQLRSASLAEDAAQGVFVALAMRAPQLAKRGAKLQLESWLHEAARLACLNLRR